MTPKPFSLDKSQVVCEIMAYLAEKPDAQDTIEGIVDWWLMEQHIKIQTAIVEQALADLVRKGVILESRGKDQRVRYRLNKRMHRGLHAFKLT